MLHGDIHIQVLHIYIHVADALLIFLALLTQLLYHPLQIGNIVRIFSDSSCISKLKLSI